jgi:predicted DNA-binding protein
MGKAVSIRLEDEVLHQLDQLSGEVNRSRSYLIKEAVHAYLEDYGDYRLALDRLLDKDDAILESSELRKRLGL